ncbi:MAG: hypothetical protein DMG40_19030 [Acidobacteria bacterium]|nr:MAG: hypothetical protein DMG40_19030 [Acidobacteriota bacterium]
MLAWCDFATPHSKTVSAGCARQRGWRVSLSELEGGVRGAKRASHAISPQRRASALRLLPILFGILSRGMKTNPAAGKSSSKEFMACDSPGDPYAGTAGRVEKTLRNLS